MCTLQQSLAWSAAVGGDVASAPLQQSCATDARIYACLLLNLRVRFLTILTINYIYWMHCINPQNS